MIKDFSSIHNHSHFSFMDGLSRPDEMIEKAKEKGLKSIALTDHGHLHGIADFYLAAKKQGVKGLYGWEAYVIDDLVEWHAMREKMKEDKKELSLDDDATNTGVAKSKRSLLTRKSHLVMLAKNLEGLSNIYNLMHIAHKDGMYMKPRVDKKMLADNAKGIVTSSACMGGVISNKCWAFKRGECEFSDIVNEARQFEEIFGKDNFYLELQFNESDSQRFINDLLMKVHLETGIPLSVTADAHYVNPEDWEAQEILYMLRGDKTVATRGDDWDFEIKQLYIKSPEEMWDAYVKFGGELTDQKYHSIIQKAFENTLYIDSMIEEFEPDTHQRLPTLPYENPFKVLGEKCIERMKQLGLDKNETYRQRFLHEMQLIKSKGFANYFLIMGQIINEAKKKMLVGPGRGSAAASLVCWLSGITGLDPIKHNLLFERFINADRVELPDIDVDFQDSDEARQILRNIFGEDNVACISSYGTFQIKGLLKDLGRVYDVDHREINRYNKKIEAELRVLYKDQDKSTIVIKLEDVQRVSQSYRELVEKYPLIGRNIERLYGRNRHVGRHACGVVIGDNLPREMPVFTSKDAGSDNRVLQASFTEGIVNKNISNMGFVKFDLLSLATLKVIDKTLKLVSERHGMTYEQAYAMIDAVNLDVNDMKVMKTVFWEGNFTGIFQFTNKGIRKVAIRVRPDQFEDIAAIGALYRPGPLKSNMDKLYADNKHNQENIKYDHPILEDIFKETYGTLVYQEQMLNVGHLLGKLSMKDTNRLRKLLLKKDKSKDDTFLDKEKTELNDKFITGCVENGLSKDKAQEIWEQLEAFGGYGFNAAHAKAYAMVTMQTAFLRTYYPLEFFTAVLSCGMADELQSYVDDIKRQGFKILPVDINKSRSEHSIEGEHIRLAFQSVKGVGAAAVTKIVSNQPYEDFYDFLYKTGGPKTATVPLVKVGAFNDIDDNVAFLEKFYDVFSCNQKLRKKSARADLEKKIAELGVVPHHKPTTIIDYENELLGFNLRGSPFELLGRAKKLSALERDGIVVDYNDFVNSEAQVAVIPVVLKDFKERAQSRGGMMCFMKFMDRDGVEFEAPAFAQVWKFLAKKSKRGGVYLLTVNRKLDEPLNLVVGKPGWGHSQIAVETYMINMDEVTE